MPSSKLQKSASINRQSLFCFCVLQSNSTSVCSSLLHVIRLYLSLSSSIYLYLLLTFPLSTSVFFDRPLPASTLPLSACSYISHFALHLLPNKPQFLTQPILPAIYIYVTFNGLQIISEVLTPDFEQALSS